MKVAINKEVTRDLIDRFSEILGCDTEVIYKRYCTPTDAEIEGFNIVLMSKQSDYPYASKQSNYPYGALFKRPANVTDDQIAAMVLVLGVESSKWADLTKVWGTYVCKIKQIIECSKPDIIKVMLADDPMDVLEHDYATRFSEILGKGVYISYVRNCASETRHGSDAHLVLSSILVNDTERLITVFKSEEWITDGDLREFAKALGSEDGTYIDMRYILN